ncbi:MAG: folate-binding protein YgfZ [Chromatocurvus sp.]
MDAYYSKIVEDSLLHFTGEQVPTFFQGQLTCDCLEVNEAQTSLGALCTAQGRVLTDCRVLQLGENHYALRLRRDVRDITRETLKKYAMFSRTDISDRDEEWTLLGVWGNDAAVALRTAFNGAPEGRNRAFWSDGLMVCQADDGGDAFELIVSSEALQAVLVALSAQAQECPESHWQQNELRRGLLRTTAEISGNHLPQVLNYDLAGLLNFRKGCYIGQEVVARLHYRGKSKRRCGVYTIPADATLKAGAELARAGDRRGVGSVLRVVGAEAEATLVVARVTVDDSEQPLLPADSAGDDPLLQPVPLPYSVRGSSDAS